MGELTDVRACLGTDGRLDADLLDAAASRGAVVLCELTDEELHLLGPEPDADPDPLLDAPRLGRLDPPARDAALTAVLHTLRVTGELELDPARPDELGARGLRALAVSMRSAAVARTTVTVEPAGATVLGLFRLDDERVVSDDVDGDGIHLLALHRGSQVVGLVPALLDEDGVEALRLLHVTLGAGEAPAAARTLEVRRAVSGVIDADGSPAAWTVTRRLVLDGEERATETDLGDTALASLLWAFVTAPADASHGDVALGEVALDA
ncbi:MAG: hypothetical protein ACLGIR_01600 [Actinomycetes bacterium]